MSFPPVEQLIHFKPPALLVSEIESTDKQSLSCISGDRTWYWFLLLDGSAQAAGLLLTLTPEESPQSWVVAGYQKVELLAQGYVGKVRWVASHKRKVMDMHQFEVKSFDLAGKLLLSSVVTLAPAHFAVVYNV